MELEGKGIWNGRPMRSRMRTAFSIFFLLALGTLAWIRLAPSDPVRWHVDPLTAQRRAEGAWLVRPEGGNAASAVYPVEPRALLAAFDGVARAAPRTRVLAGSVEEGRITYVSRSRIMGFPDYITATALARPGGAALAVFSRLRFGRSDMGVNRARAERWLAEVPAALSATGWA